MKKILLILTVCCLWLCTAAASDEIWLQNMEKAKQAAQSDGKDILVLYKIGEYLPFADENPELLFHSTHFTNAARRNYVLVKQQMPLSDPEDSPSSVIVFCDALGRPYYSFSSEWTMGMDWVLEELAIAAERKPVIQKILQSLDRQPGKNPDFRLIGQLFLSMPDGIEQFHASYRNWMEETLKNDGEDSSGLKKRARRIEEMEQFMGKFTKIISTAESPEQLNTSLQPYQAQLNDSPPLKQFVEFYLGILPHIQTLKKDSSLLDSFLGGSLKKEVARIISISPHSKMSRYLRTHLTDEICMIECLISLDRLFKENLKEAFQLLEKFPGKNKSYAFRQLQLLLRGRLLAEQGDWDGARQSLRQAIPLNPLSFNAQTAQSLLQTISTNQSRLQELLPLKRRGSEETDKEWDELLLMENKLSIYFRFTGLDEYFN